MNQPTDWPIIQTNKQTINLFSLGGTVCYPFQTMWWYSNLLKILVCMRIKFFRWIEEQWALSIKKTTGSNFRNFHWSDGTRSQNSRSRALQLTACWVKLCCVWKWRTFWAFSQLLSRMTETILSCTILDGNDDVIRPAAVACFIGRELTRVNITSY